MPLRGIYIPHFDQISVKISVLGVLYPYHCTDGVKFGMQHHQCNVSPHRDKKPQNRPLSNFNNRRFALRAMLPVNDCEHNMAQ